jgi:hypothetical protein
MVWLRYHRKDPQSRNPKARIEDQIDISRKYCEMAGRRIEKDTHGLLGSQNSLDLFEHGCDIIALTREFRMSGFGMFLCLLLGFILNHLTDIDLSGADPFPRGNDQLL